MVFLPTDHLQSPLAFQILDMKDTNYDIYLFFSIKMYTKNKLFKIHTKETADKMIS